MSAAKRISCGVVIHDDFDPGLSLEKLYKLGSIFVDNYQVKLKYIRTVINSDLSEKLNALGISDANGYNFLTRNGDLTLPLTANQEQTIELMDVVQNDIIVINKKTDMPQIQILTENNHQIGVIEAKLTTCLKMLRKDVGKVLRKSEEFKKYRKISSFWWNPRCKFHFLKRSGELISSFNEESLNLLNIVDNTNNSIRINFKTKDKIDCRRRLEPMNLSIPPMISDDKHEAVISYNREEASEQAELLHCKLDKLNLKVFLDKHDIHGGSDWQDRLNTKIRECTFFLPFITKKYGKTQWTDYELKAAVVLKKYIIPIKFTEKYPPDNYYIQLGSVQYLEATGEIAPRNNTSRWSEEEAGRVAIEITKVINQVKQKLTRIGFDANGHEIHSDSKKSNKITFLVHPSQKLIYEQISQRLTSQFKQYSVKCCVNYGEPIDQLSRKTLNQEKSSKFERQYSVFERERLKKEAKLQLKSAKIVIALYSNEFSKSNLLLDYFKFARLNSNVNVVLCDCTQLKGWLSQYVSSYNCYSFEDDYFNEKLEKSVEKQIQLDEVELQIETSNSLGIQFMSLPLEYNTVFICFESNTVLENETHVFTEFAMQLLSLKNYTIVTYGVNCLAECISKQVELNADKESECLKVVNIRTASECEEDAVEDERSSNVRTVFVANTEREVINEISMVCDICITIIDCEQNSNAFYSFAWNEKRVIPVLMNENVELVEMSDTFDALSTLYNVTRSQLTLNENNATEVAETVSNLVEILELD